MEQEQPQVLEMVTLTIECDKFSVKGGFPIFKGDSDGDIMERLELCYRIVSRAWQRDKVIYGKGLLAMQGELEEQETAKTHFSIDELDALADIKAKYDKETLSDE